MPEITPSPASPRLPNEQEFAELTPRRVVAELDRFIIGQNNAKRSVAVALRNRWRRQQVAPEMRKEIGPKNIMMIGPTGVGKTEIVRRLAAMTRAPFIKVEATKYTEVGYHGRDVESMVRELVENAIGIVRDDLRARNESAARAAAEERLVDLIAEQIPKWEQEADQAERSLSDPEPKEGEIIRCQNCKYYNPEEDEDSWSSESCDHPLLDATDPYEWYGLRVNPDDFCSRGERRTDERSDGQVEIDTMEKRIKDCNPDHFDYNYCSVRKNHNGKGLPSEFCRYCGACMEVNDAVDQC